MHMMIAFGFCMYCLWKNRNYLLHLPHYILHTHNTPAHFDDLFSCVSGHTSSHSLRIHTVT